MTPIIKIKNLLAGKAGILKSALIITIIIICLPLFLPAQKYNFKNYTVANGLAGASVNHIFQDSKGYIWFATQGGGISRFNGKEFKNFTKADGLISNDVTYVTEDRYKNIWIATAEGASQFDGNRFTNYNQASGLTNHVVYCIYADEQNKIWFATENRGVRVMNSPLLRRGVGGEVFDSIVGLPTGEVYTICNSKHGNLYFGLANGIAKYTNGKVEILSSPTEKLSDKSFFSSMTDAGGNVLFGSMTGNFIAIHPDNNIENIQLPASIQHDFIGCITQDEKGNIWLATDHGLLKYSGKEFKLFSESEGLSVNTVQTVLADYEGNIWAGTLSGGADLLSSEAFLHYTEKDGLNFANVTDICPDIRGKTYYIGTSGGLYLLNPAIKPSLTKSNMPDKANIYSQAVDAKGNLWLCAQEGIFVLEKQGNSLRLKKRYTEVAEHRVISPLKIIHDTKGNTWIATYGSGVFVINNGTEKNLTRSNGFASEKTLTVFEDSKSNIWFGTQDAGVIKYDGKKFTTLLPGQSVWTIAEDNNGNLFFGTGENGVYRYDGKTTENYSTKNGLSSNYITALNYDKKQNCLYLGSEKGLDKLKFTTDNKIETQHTYNQQDGFKSVGINQNGIYTNQKGEVWLGTVNGLWQCNVAHIFEKNTSTKIQLTDIRLSYQKVDWRTLTDTVDRQTNLPVNLNLTYNKNHLTFDIQALTVNDVLYTYMLQGQDDSWSLPTKNNEITFSNISPGKYIFRAKAVNNQGKQSEQTVEFAFTIQPPWWKTWWFYILVVTTSAIALAIFIKTRERLLIEQNVKLENVVKQRTLVIEQQKLTVEKMLSEKEVLLKEIHHRVKNNLQTISSMLMLQSLELKDEEAKKAIKESQSRVHSIALVHQKLYQTDGLEKVELNGFFISLTEQIKALYRLPSVNISVQINIPETYILIDKAIPLGLIINELFTNSLKYAFTKTQFGQINIDLIHLESDSTVKSISRKVKLIYKDNGAGFDYNGISKAANTLGVELIELLSEQIGATLSYSKHNGSEFVFIFGINI